MNESMGIVSAEDRDHSSGLRLAPVRGKLTHQHSYSVFAVFEGGAYCSTMKIKCIVCIFIATWCDSQLNFSSTVDEKCVKEPQFSTFFTLHC